MTTPKPSEAAMKAAKAICNHPRFDGTPAFTESELSEIIDRETGLSELVKGLQSAVQYIEENEKDYQEHCLYVELNELLSKGSSNE